MRKRNPKEKIKVHLFSGLGRTLAISFLVFALVPMTLIGIISYFKSYNSLDQEIRQGLRNVSELKTREISAYFNSMLAQLKFQSETERSLNLLKSLTNAHKQSEKPLADFVRSPEWTAITHSQATDIRNFRKSFNYYDVFLIRNNGDILFSVANESDLGTNLFNGALSSSKFAEACKRTIITGTLSFSDYEHYAPSDGHVYGFITAPIVNGNGGSIGVMAFQLPIAPITQIMKSGLALGNTAESYLVGEDLTLRSGLMRDEERALIDKKILTDQMRKIRSKNGANSDTKKVFVYQGPHGKPVLGIRRDFKIENVIFSTIAEVEKAEAFAAILGLRDMMLALVGLTGLVVAVFVVLMVKRIVRPVIQLSSGVQRVEAGDYSQLPEIKTKNEIGYLAGSFNTMVKALKKNREENARKEWFRTGQMDLNTAMRGNSNLPDLCRNIISFLAKYLKAEIGAIYIINSNGCLQLFGGYAFSIRKHLSNEYQLGEGLVGQAALEKERILLTNVPDDYIAVRSGLGEIAPKTIVVKPFLRENTILGVIELGALNPFSENALEFIDTISDSVAVSIQTILTHVQVQELLGQSQDQANELKKREEELQKSNLSLQQQTEELRTSEERLQKQQEELRQTNDELERHTTALKKSESALLTQQKELQQFNKELEKKTEYLERQKKDIESKNEELEQARHVIEEKAKQLELSSKYKSEFLSNMSHELRTPLNSILLLSKLFVDNKDKSMTEDQVDSAQAIYSSGNDLLRLINEILDLSKIESGKMDINPENIDLTHLANSVSRSFKHLTEEKGIELIVDLSEDLPNQIFSDFQRLEQIIKNFISNSLKFTTKGSISFKIYLPQESEYRNKFIDFKTIPKQMIAFSIIDTGIGIPEEKQKLIFEAFQQADGTTSRKYGGTGLGLSISRELAKKLGGKIGLVSKPNEGSSFTLYIPEKHFSLAQLEAPPHASRETQESKKKPTPDQMENIADKPVAADNETSCLTNHIEDDRRITFQGDKSILIIEDDSLFAKTLRDLSRENGFKCLISSDGESGLHFADFYKPSAIILDIGLPGISGWTVMARLKENPSTRHIPVYFISAVDKKREAMRMGAIGFLIKPVTSTTLPSVFKEIDSVISKKTKDLLLIEDNKNQVKAITKLIGNGDLKITPAYDAKSGLNEIKSGKYDCVILDLKLPDMSGMELLSKIKTLETSHRLPVIIYTGKELNREERSVINQYAETTIIKGANSHKMLLYETTLFLHRMEENLPEQQKKEIRLFQKKKAMLKGKKILVVDDDMRNVFSLKKLLEGHGMKVVVGKNGQEGLDKLKSIKNIALILMDIMMPEMDGYEATQLIKGDDAYKKIPIIALTAKAMKGDKAKCIEAGANDYLAKPIDPEQLLSMLRVWLYS